MLGDGVVCLDFGTAQKIGKSFFESFVFSLNMERKASTEYDLVCLRPH
jgi:hypothetical protein